MCVCKYLFNIVVDIYIIMFYILYLINNATIQIEWNFNILIN